MSVALRAALLLLLLGAIAAFAVFVSGGDAPQPAPTTFTSSTQCASCHQDVWNEWLGSHHQIAYLNPEVRQLSDDFRNKECQACHLPRPVASTGYGRRTLHRTTLPDEGVSCLTCHLGADGGILGRRSLPGAPCAPRASADLVSVGLCESCHNQHQTTDQWRQTPFPAAGTDCNACHMPEVARPGGRTGRGHAYAGSHDAAMLRRAVTLSARVEAKDLIVAVANTGAGHNFPTEERSRAADVAVRFDDAGEWQRLHRFRLPYRSEPLPDTTLPHGARHEMRAPIPDGASRAAVRLWYRLTPFVGDDDPRSALLFEQHFELGPQPVGSAVVEPPLPEQSAFQRPATPAPIPPPAAVATAAAAGASDGELPSPQLVPKLEHFRALAAAGPQPPDDGRLRELRELLQAAFVPGAATARMAALARRSLLESEGARPVLEEALGHDDAEVRAQAAFELGRLGEQAAVLPLVLRMKYEADGDTPVVLAWIADALMRLGNRSGLPHLIGLIARADTAQLAGQRAIEICAAAGLDAGATPSWDDLTAALRRLHDEWRAAGTGPPVDAATHARIAAHLVALEDFQLRGVDEARYVLARLGQAPVALLREALHASEPYLRTHALEILRELGPAGAAAAPDVAALLGDELTRADAARALGRIGARDAVPHLLTCLRAGDLELRAAAAGALGPLGDRAAIAPLRAMHADQNHTLDVRVQAAFSLALLEPDGGTRAWLETLLATGDYHGPTLQELLDRIARGG